MASDQPGERCSYTVDRNGIITGVSGNWQAFAEANQAADSVSATAVVGTALWQHIHDVDTRYLYDTVMQKVRASQHAVRFPFRCDAPALRRFLHMTVSPHADGACEFSSVLLRSESRLPVALWRVDAVRSDELVRVCSMCKKIALDDDHWAEVEEAVERLHLFACEAVPQLTHSLCPACFQQAMDELER